jgi:uncharacterized protein
LRKFTLDDIEDLCLGATLLGTGGGGDPYVAKLVVRQAIEEFGPVDVVDVAELPPDGLVLTIAIIGAPTVILEKIPAGTEFIGSVKALAAYLGKQPVALMAIEVGGLNTLLPIATAAELGLPVVDADSMRRAFPQIEMTVFTLAGLKATPLAIADEKGNMCVFEAVTNLTAERLARTAVIQLGLANAISCYPLVAQQIADHGILGSLSYCTDLGRQLAAVQRGDEGAWARFLDEFDSVELFTGKVVDIDRRTTEGFARGTVVLEHLVEPARVMRIEIQNENLIAFEDGVAVATVPDLICMLDLESYQPITTEQIAYGQRVHVIGMPCAPEWHQPGMLDVVGPRAFGYEVDAVELPRAGR